MKQLLYEGRFLAEITANVVRQENLKIVHNRIDWERIYRLADYHRIAPVMYLGLLGNGEVLPDRWSQRFFLRYQEALQYGVKCEAEEQTLLKLLSEKKAFCIVFSNSRVRSLYPLPEMAGKRPLSLLTDRSSYSMVKGFLIDLGYETANTFQGFGESMVKEQGIEVEIYHTLPFVVPAFQKEASWLMDTAEEEEGFPEGIPVLPLESDFLFRMARASYRYVTDSLKLWEMLDLMMFHRKIKDSLSLENIQAQMKDLGIEDLSWKLLELSYFWFGSKAELKKLEQKEDMTVFDMLENRILLMGQDSDNQEKNEQALQLAEQIQKAKAKAQKKEEKNILKEKRKESRAEFRKMLRWVFPDYHYMCTIYPKLERLPVLLPFFWCCRGLRILKRALKRQEK